MSLLRLRRQVRARVTSVPQPHGWWTPLGGVAVFHADGRLDHITFPLRSA